MYINHNAGNATVASYVDARIVFLHSRGPKAHEGPLRLRAPDQFYTFNYYDAISVKSAGQLSHSSLLEAYKKTLELGSADISVCHQVLLSFADIGGKYGYTQDELNTFWADQSKPVFFLSMLHLTDGTDPTALIDRLRTVPLRGRCYIYFTFDHSDILVFYKGCSFREYATYIMTVTYTLPKVLADSITLYSFSSLADAYVPENCRETFGAYLKIGVSDYARWAAFRNKILKKPGQAFDCWLLGRNDVALFCRKANLSWLRSIWKQATAGRERPWYTTYDLSILIDPDDAGLLKPAAGSENQAPVRKKAGREALGALLKKRYEKYRTAYADKCDEIHAAHDEVWLRWLLESYATAESLLNSTLASDLGVCLVPQFLDFFQFATPVFQCADFSWDDVASMNHCCSAFFANISTLIDSMNHSNRQFIQVPSFQSASFEMPPKIMAFYVALGHQLIAVLRDDDASYGFTISPSFVETLSVYSLGPAPVYGIAEDDDGSGRIRKRDINNNEFLSIAVDERALYTLSTTIETLAHEFSHFLGGENRCRAVRKEHILLGVLEEFLVSFLAFFSDVLRSDYPIPAREEEYSEPVVGSLAAPFAKNLLSVMRQVKGYFCGPDDTYMMDEVQNLITYLPTIICKDHSLREIVFDFVIASLFSGPESKFWQRLQTYLGDALPEGSYMKRGVTQSQSKLIKYNVYCITMRALDMFVQDSGRSTCAMLDRETAQELCYLYRETFADIQAILLLDMKWASYDQLLDDNLVSDISIRKLAVAKALVSVGHWDVTDVKCYGCGPASRLIACDPTKEDEVSRFSQDAINVQVLEHLTQYLIRCSTNARRSFNNSKKADEIQTLRNTYKIVANRNDMMCIETALMAVIARFRQSVKEGRI